MKESVCNRPYLLVSSCLLGINCRYNAIPVAHPEVLELMDRFSLVPCCPEQLGGLPTPRNPAERKCDRVINRDGADVSSEYLRGAEEALKLCRIMGIKCAVLKERSPSCGSGIIHDGSFSGKLIEGDGVTSQLLKLNGIRVYGESSYSDLLSED